MLCPSDGEMSLDSEDDEVNQDSEDDEDDQEDDEDDGRDSGYESMSSDDEFESERRILQDEPPHCSTPNNSPITISSDEEDTRTPMRQHAVSPFPPLVLDSPGPFDDYLFSAARSLKTKKRFRNTSSPLKKPKAARRLFSNTI
jgi:hypothetical protein